MQYSKTYRCPWTIMNSTTLTSGANQEKRIILPDFGAQPHSKLLSPTLCKCATMPRKFTRETNQAAKTRHWASEKHAEIAERNLIRVVLEVQLAPLEGSSI